MSPWWFLIVEDELLIRLNAVMILEEAGFDTPKLVVPMKPSRCSKPEKTSKSLHRHQYAWRNIGSDLHTLSVTAGHRSRLC
jgi:hypothetical protein